MKFIKEFFTAFGKLLLKLIGSRKAFFQIVSKLIALHLILVLKNELYIITVYAISTASDLVYMGVIEFEKVQTNISINK